jgi:2-amino-4-hydroxy-6-hydroxymethyldihydropteridine diphosphokinase
LSAQNNPGGKLVLISLGSNIEPEKNLSLALKMLADEVELLKQSSIWQTPAVGSNGPDYLNAAVLIQSPLSLDLLKGQILSAIELKLGRIRTNNKNEDRSIDLDIVMVDGKCLDEDLWNQAHVAIPASELIPECKNPQSGETLSQAAQRLFPVDTSFFRVDISSNDA